MIYFKKPKKIPDLRIEINNKTIDRVDNFNFLGITLDQHITWKQHTDKIGLKLSRVIGLLRRLQHILPPYILITIYHSLIHSHLNYGLLLWGCCNGRIANLQKKAIRVVAYRPYIAHTSPIFKELNIMKLSDIYTTQLHKLLYRYENNILPDYFSLFKPLYSGEMDHSYNLRHNTLRLPMPSKNYFVQGTRYQFLKLSATLSQGEINLTHGPTRFEYISRIKTDIISQYDPICHIANCYVCNNT